MNIYKLPIIIGPTAVGKTDIAIHVAKEIEGEILSADSRQVYQGMDIGTSKPTPEEQRQIKHHLIDLVSPDVHYSSGDYARDAETVLSSYPPFSNSPFTIHQSPITEAKLPLLVGGSGLYIRALINGYFESPPVDKELRKRLEEEDLDILFQKLKKVDPQSAERIHPNDRQRITRALEVYEQTGLTMTRLQTSIPNPKSSIQPFFIGLNRDRDDLYQRIDGRVDRMIGEGLVEEVEGLLEKEYSPDLESFKAVGYREIIRYLEGEISKDEAIQLMKRNTRHFARRQLTWFRKVEGVEWITLKEDTVLSEISLNIAREIQKICRGISTST
jgi:tRNA dimethylallyltransferase